MADSSRHNFNVVDEVTYGTTPATPTFTDIRHTGVTLALTKTNLSSEELYEDRQVRVDRHGVKQVGGDVNTELSYGTFDKFWESLMQSTFGTGETVTDTTISAANSDNSLNDSNSGFGSFSAGDLISVSGFTGASTTANTDMVIVSATSAKIVVSGVTLIDDAAGESVTITQYDTLLVGTTRKSFSGLRDFSDITTGRYFLYTGLEVNALTLNATPDSIVTANWTFLGKDQTTSDSGPSGSTIGTATTTDVFDSFSGTIQDNNADIAIVTAMDLTIENGLEARFVIGSNTTLLPTVGRAMISGNITVYFEDTALYNKFVNETSSSLNFSFNDAAGNKMRFYLPSIKYNGGQPDATGQGAITLSMPIKALYDVTAGSTLAIGNLDA